MKLDLVLSLDIEPELAPLPVRMASPEVRVIAVHRLAGKQVQVEIEGETQQTMPTRGSVTLSTFEVASGRRAQFDLRRADGSAAPFGAVIKNEKGERFRYGPSEAVSARVAGRAG